MQPKGTAPLRALPAPQAVCCLYAVGVGFRIFFSGGDRWTEITHSLLSAGLDSSIDNTIQYLLSIHDLACGALHVVWVGKCF